MKNLINYIKEMNQADPVGIPAGLLIGLIIYLTYFIILPIIGNN
jgi:hypothetical protein